MNHSNMSQSVNRSRPSQRITHVSEDLRNRSICTEEQFAQFGELDIYNVVQPASEIEVLFAHHTLVLQINAFPNHRQVNRFAEQEHDGSLTPGDFFLVPAKTPSFFTWNQTDESMIFSIEPTTLQQIAIETNCLNPTQVELRPIILGRDAKLEFFAKAFQEEIQHNGVGRKLYGESLANLFLIHLLRNYCAFEPKLKDYNGGLSSYKLKQAIAYINDHLSENICLEEIAQEVGMSQYYFCRLFKQSTGLSPYQYLMQQRVERAKQLLQHSNLSIADIALTVGFFDQSRMAKHLKRLTGITPKQLRNK